MVKLKTGVKLTALGLSMLAASRGPTLPPKLTSGSKTFTPAEVGARKKRNKAARDSRRRNRRRRR